MLSIIALASACIAFSTLLFFWISGQARVDLVRVHTETEIAATKAQVWQVLADFGAYPDWNPLMIKVVGDVKPRGRMDWSSRLNGEVRDYNARIDRVRPLQELSWTGPISGLGRTLFWGEHRFIIEDAPNGRVRLINTERFGGLMTIPLRAFLQRDVHAAYEATNRALKARAEAE